MTALILIFAAASAALAFEVFYRLRQRSLAKARALGFKVEAGRSGIGSLRQAWSEGVQAMAQRLELRLPAALKQGLAERLAQASLAQAPGLLALNMLLACMALLILGFMLDLGSYAFVGALLGLALPLLKVNDLASKRQAALRKVLPDALDLLTACVEAGLGFDQALARVASRPSPGPLQKELEACVAALGVGASRREALMDLERRARLEELSQLLAALLQADKRGVPLAPVLRSQSGQLRSLRSLRVKKLAAEAPLKMLFPLMVFILPVVFLFLFGPIFLKWKAGGF